MLKACKCDNCKLIFSSSVIPDTCPWCGSDRVMEGDEDDALVLAKIESTASKRSPKNNIRSQAERKNTEAIFNSFYDQAKALGVSDIEVEGFLNSILFAKRKYSTEDPNSKI